MKAAWVATALVMCLVGGSPVDAHQAYCYATAQKTGSKLERAFGNQCTMYLTPIFPTDASGDLLAAEFAEALPDAGLATCVTDESETDLGADRQNLIDGSSADKCAVVAEPPPGDAAATPQPSQ